MEEKIILGVTIGLFLIIPFLSGDLFCRFVDSLGGRLTLIGVLLYGISLGTTPGIFTFLVIAAVFAERNRLRIYRAQEYIIAHGSPRLDKTSVSAPEQLQQEDVQTDGANTSTLASMYLSPTHLDTTHLDISPPDHVIVDEKTVAPAELVPNEKQADFYIDNKLLSSSSN